MILTPEPVLSVLDNGNVRCVEVWGRGDAGEMECGIVEAARQSTQGGFRGWEPGVDDNGKSHKGDASLLRYMFEHDHATPFEFAGLVIEVTAPLFVVGQWNRHRVLSINQASGRYGPLPDRWYMPTLERVMSGAQPTANKQAAGLRPLSATNAMRYRQRLARRCEDFARDYAEDNDAGVPNELARLGMPQNWYTYLRYSSNLRGWLSWLTLRLDRHAQWEHRQYAETVAFNIIAKHFPRTWNLFLDRNARGSR